MKVVFDKTLSNDSFTELSIEKIDNDTIYLNIEYTNFCNREQDRQIGHFFNKKELKDFIGALLHIQSKLNRNE